METAAYAHGAWQAALVTIVFTAAAWLLNGVTRSGALAGALVSFAIYLSAGPGAFLALVSVFVIAVGTTRIGYTRKQALGMAEGLEGRSASQIVANVGIAAVASLLSGLSRDPAFLIAGAAALTEAAADTAASEIGQATSGQARLITTFERVPVGTNGGITISGTLAGAVASLLVAACCVLVKMISESAFLLVTGAGFAGMLLDSVLGALVERPRALNNDAVNLLGTFSAALIALLVSRARH